MSQGPVNGTLAPSEVEEVVLLGTVFRVRVSHTGPADSNTPIFFNLGAVDDPALVEDPEDGSGSTGVYVVDQFTPLTVPVRRGPEDSLDQVVVKLLSDGAVGYSVASV